MSSGSHIKYYNYKDAPMATGMHIPPLHEGMRIGDWKHLFLASVQQIVDGENGQKRAIQLLPACVNRRPAERELVRDVVKKSETVERALQTLEDVLDPPVDQYQMMQELCRSDWEPGSQVDDFFFGIRRKAFHAGMGMKFVASILASQLPKDIQSKLRDKVRDVDDDIDGVDGQELIRTVKRELTERGYLLDMGSKDFEKVKRVAVLSKPIVAHPPQSPTAEDSTEPQPPMNDMVAYSRSQTRSSHWTRQPRTRQSSSPVRGCYICGGSHAWKYCPEKRCPICGEKGHTLKECQRKGGSKGSKRILNLYRPNMGTELSVLLPVKLNGKPVTVILDSGANSNRPSSTGAPTK